MWFILRLLLLLLFLLAVKTHQGNDQEVPFTDDELALSSLYFGNETLWSSGILDDDNSTLNASSYSTTVTVDRQPEAETLEENGLPSHTQRLQKAQFAFQLQQPTSSSNQSQEPQLPLPTYPPSETLCPPLMPPQAPPQLPVLEHHSPTLWQLEVPQQQRSPLQRLGMAQVSPEPHSPPQQLWVPEQPGLSRQHLDVVQMRGSPLQQLQFAEVLQQPRSQLQQAGSPVQQMPQEQGSQLHWPQVPQQPSFPLQWQQVAQVLTLPVHDLTLPEKAARLPTQDATLPYQASSAPPANQIPTLAISRF
ncbi:glutenin, low molecular weight subunit 1D1-like isoform X3 [Archocentrus centrarchus]|uniref:glutenin, low molecular weight subunit 1D1-like isoform X3 n=1 Tax=Archocentrus centrarchus TaxID=63155 RepID=UPI0011EA352A|nr:glutenin, low molecular weight subunit 1D1-like isoform X3 [Archocentrus centrarchus]